MFSVYQSLKTPFVSRVSGLFRIRSSGIVGASALSRSLIPRRGLEEFEDRLGGDVIGRAWEAAELRLKSYEDLRKLWFVLLKERNMLESVRHEHRRNKTDMPGHERIFMVRKSMARIKLVVREREIAQKEKEFSERRKASAEQGKPYEETPEERKWAERKERNRKLSIVKRIKFLRANPHLKPRKKNTKKTRAVLSKIARPYKNAEN